MAKRAREQAVREKREEKAAKKAAKTTRNATAELDEFGNPIIPERITAKSKSKVKSKPRRAYIVPASPTSLTPRATTACGTTAADAVD